MRFPRTFTTLGLTLFGLGLAAFAQPAPEKPKPDARFQNWLYKAPDPAVWKRSEKNGNLVFAVDQPPGDFCMITLFADAKAEGDFTDQFNSAVDADQKAKDTVKIEADSGAKAGKSAEGYDTLTRNLRAETKTAHSFHIYVGGRSGDRFNLAVFQTSSEGSWKYFGAQASQAILSLKMANALSPEAVAALVGPAANQGEPPPALPGFDDFPAAPTAATTARVVPPAAAPAPQPMAVAPVPDRPLASSPLVVNNAVVEKSGKPIQAIKLSQHDLEIASPSLAIAPNGVIHAAFVEKHRTTYQLAVYHRSSSDGGKTWTEAKNLSEDMPRIQVGLCFALVDARGRLYVIWRAGLAVDFQARADPGGAGQSNIMYRVLENGKWSKIMPVHPEGSAQTQDDGSLSYFARIDAAGRAQVVWNALPDHWHPEYTHVSGTSHQHLAYVGPGLVFAATLDGTAHSAPREVYLTPATGMDEQGGYGTYCDGLDALNGYVDAAGSPHFLAAVTRTHDDSLRGKSRYQLFENGQAGTLIDLPELSFHGWRDIPTLLVDAAGRKHAIVLYPAGEHPSIRDYLLGSEEEPVVIRASVGVKGTVDGMQAYQGPGGRMIAVMQMNDSGERANGETYVSISTGKAWSTPVNVTNNAGRYKYAFTKTSKVSNVAVETSYYPGPAAAAIDPDGHLLLLMINNEYGLFGSSALGVQLTGGSSSTPVLQFLRF